MVIVPVAFVVNVVPALMSKVPVPLLTIGAVIEIEPVLFMSEAFPSVMVTEPLKLATLVVKLPVVFQVKSFPGELKTMLPVPAVRVKSSFTNSVNALSVALTAPEMVISESRIAFDARVSVPVGATPEPVRLTVTPAATVNTLANVVPQLKVKLAEFEVFVTFALIAMLELAFIVSELFVSQLIGLEIVIVPVWVPAAAVEIVTLQVPRFVTRFAALMTAVLAVTL